MPGDTGPRQAMACPFLMGAGSMDRLLDFRSAVHFNPPSFHCRRQQSDASKQVHSGNLRLGLWLPGECITDLIGHQPARSMQPTCKPFRLIR
jgi:hypothetical protein